MAQFTTANAVGEREDLSDIIYRLDTTETPFFSTAKKTTVKKTEAKKKATKKTTTKKKAED